MRGHGADTKRVRIGSDACQIAHAPKVDQLCRRSKAEFHRAEQRLAAGDKTRFR